MSEPRLDLSLFIACCGEEQILVDSVPQITGVLTAPAGLGNRSSWTMVAATRHAT
jgi:hypothetical protein